MKKNHIKQPFYVFLDVDGVLNSYDGFRKRELYYRFDGRVGLAKNNVDALKKLVLSLTNDYETCVIVTSMWRLEKDGLENLQHLSKDYCDWEIPVVGQTGSLPDKHRGLEILSWLKDHHNGRMYPYYLVIDDDMSEMKRVIPKSHRLKTTFVEGLNLKTVDQFLERWAKIDAKRKKYRENTDHGK